tara:strand:- start:2695 stop:3123 length:429 start_codon:yes stop_codon:yes gene_type:complete
MSSLDSLLEKYKNFITYNENPNHTHKATISILVKNFTSKKFKGTEPDIISLVTLLGNLVKKNNICYNKLGTVVIDLKNVTRNNFSVSYFSKIYKVIDKTFYKEDIVDKIICFCNSNIPTLIFQLVKPMIDPTTVKKFKFYKV